MSMRAIRSPEETHEQLRQHMQDLATRLEDAESTIRAIRQDEIDALVVSSRDGPRVYTLRSADHPYRMLVQEMQDGALTLTPTGLILYANPACARMMRTPLEHIVGTAVQRFVVPHDLQTFTALFERGARGNSRGEVRLQAADGTLVPVLLACQSLRVDDVQSVCLAITNLTEHKRQEEILASEALTHAILEQVAEVLVVVDKTGRIIRASQAAHQLAGRNVLAQDFAAVFPLQFDVTRAPAPSVAGNGARPASPIHAAWWSEVRQGLEATFVRPDGQIFQLLLSLGPLLNATGDVAGGIITLTDITACKQAEHGLQQAHLERDIGHAQHFALLGRLAASLAHEIRTPLAAIFLYVDLLKAEVQQPTPESPAQIAQAFSEISTQLVRLDDLVQDYLSLVRVNHMQLQPEDLGAYVQSWGTELQVQAAIHDITLQLGGVKSLGQVIFHASTLRRAVLNLLQNALDATPNGGTVSLAGHSTATQVQLQVRDTGSGITAERLGHIFEPLYTTKPEGTGLGLYVVQEIVTAHGGQITVQSMEGQGTTFRITLPRVPAGAPVPAGLAPTNGHIGPQ